MNLRCGKCGYDVHGLPTSICPECGSDLEVVGRVHPQTSRLKQLERVILYGLVLPLLTIVVIHVLDCTVLPGVVQERAIIILRQPRSHAYIEFRTTLHTSGWYFPGTHSADNPWQSCQVTLHDLDSQLHTIIVKLDDYTFNKDDVVTLPRLVTTRNLLTWLADAGVDTARTGVEAEVAVIEQLIAKANAPGALFAKQGRQVVVTGGSKTSWGPSPSSQTLLRTAGIDPSLFGNATVSYAQRLDGAPVIDEARLVIIGAVLLFGIWRILRTMRASDTSVDVTTSEE